MTNHAFFFFSRLFVIPLRNMRSQVVRRKEVHTTKPLRIVNIPSVEISSRRDNEGIEDDRNNMQSA